MSFANTNLDVIRDVIPVRHNSSSLSIHPYFGKVDPGLASKSVELLSRPGDTVLDPFCGSGTVIHDAIRLGRNAIGWDSSPLAILISTAKVLGISKEEESELSAFTFNACPDLSGGLFTNERELDDSSVPEMPRIRSISDWFAPNALRELAHLRNKLLKVEKSLSPVAFLYARLAFSRIITAASLQKGESSYCRASKPDHLGRVLKLYQEALTSIIKATNTFSIENREVLGMLNPDRLVKKSNGYTICHKNVTVDLVTVDSRSISEDVIGSPRANLVTTSPPYLMSWDYGLYHKFRFYWLGFDLDGYEDTEIGRHLRRKDDDVPRYVDDMTKIFSSLRKATISSAHVVMVNAPSVVYGKEVDTNQLLIECAARSSWKCIWDQPTIGIPGPHHGMYGSLVARGASAPGAAGKKEHVLVFNKTI